MRSPNRPWRKLAMACAAVALTLLSATAVVLGAQPPERWPGSHLGLNTAIADSDAIVTAEIGSMGIGMFSAAKYYFDVRIKDSAIHKGAAEDRHSIGCGMTILFEEATPHEGQDYLCFLKGRNIIKVLPKTEENLKALSATSRRVEVLMGGADGRLLGSGIALDEAVKRSDTIEAVVFDSYSPQTVSGATKLISRVDVTPTSPFFKGKWADMISQERRTYGLTGLAQEALPGIGEQFVVFVKDRVIFKVDWNTRANRDAIDRLTTQH